MDGGKQGNTPDKGRLVRGGGGRTLTFVITAMLLGYVLAGWGRTLFRDKSEAERRFETMNTYGRIRVMADRNLTESPARLAELAEEAVRRVNDLMSPVGELSDVRRLNEAKAGEWISVDPLTWRVVMEALRWHRLSGGAFDPTIGPVKRLFRFDQGEMEDWPSGTELREARAAVGADKLLFDREGMRLAWKRDGMRLDLGAIAKGFGADRAAEVLVRNGVTRALVDIGGELRLLGRREDGDGGEWRTGIKSPRSEDIIERLDLENVAVATSGDYERYFTHDGVRYDHIIDPRTGLPLTRGPASVTVLHPTSCLTADALATTLCVLGPEAGGKFLEEQSLGLFANGGVRVVMLIPGDGDEWRRVDMRVDEGGKTSVTESPVTLSPGSPSA